MAAAVVGSRVSSTLSTVIVGASVAPVINGGDVEVVAEAVSVGLITDADFLMRVNTFIGLVIASV